MSATHRINVTARNVDHWSWSVDGGADNMMPPGSTYADITIGGSIPTIAVGDVVGLGVWAREERNSTRDSDIDDDHMRAIILDGIFDEVVFPRGNIGATDNAHILRRDETLQSLIDTYGNWTDTAFLQLINSIPTTSTANAWSYWDIETDPSWQNQVDEENGAVGLPATYNGGPLPFNGTINGTVYNLGIIQNSVYSPTSMSDMQLGFWNHYGSEWGGSGLKYRRIYQIEVIS